mgnify:CR=1 FL=1
MNGIQSIMNELKYSFKRGDKIKYTDRFGKLCKGTYVMASSADGYLVLNRGNGQPVVIPVEKIIN